MKRYFHLLWFEVLRLKWVLIWLLGLAVVDLTVRAWLVFGPVGENWPEAPGLNLFGPLACLTLIFISAALFLEHTNVATRSSVLTQAIPRLLFPVVKLTLLAFVLGFLAVFSSMMGRIHGSPASDSLGMPSVAAICLVVAWLAAQSERPVGIAKHLALWAVGIYAYTLVFAIVAANVHYDLPPEGAGNPLLWLLALMALAPPVIILHYITRCTWLKVVASVVAILILFDAPYWTLPASATPDQMEVPLSPDIEGQATITALKKQHYATDLHLRLEPGLLAPSEFAIIGSATLQTGGGPLQLGYESWSYKPRYIPDLRQDCLEQKDNSVTNRKFETGTVTLPSVHGGEASLHIFRLAQLPGVIKSDQTAVTYRINGRNERLSVNRQSTNLNVTWIRTGFERSFPAEPWRHDLRQPGPTLVHGTAPDFPPLLVELPPGQTMPTTGGFVKRSFIATGTAGKGPDLRRRQLEFFEDHFVRTVRVRLVMEK